MELQPLRARRSAIVALVSLACLAAATVSCSSDQAEPSQTPTSTAAGSGNHESGSRHELVGSDGRFAFAAPRLAEKVSIVDDGDGATIRFKVAYDVANRVGQQGVAPDRAEVTLRVARSMMSMGPQPNDIVHTATVKDSEPGSTGATRSYELDLPAQAKAFLDDRGLSSTDEGIRAEALELVSVSVQHHRDHQVVDGEPDWIHGSTFTANQGPTKPSDKPGGALTVRNDTATGIYTYPSSTLEPVPQNYGPNLYPDPNEWTVVSPTSTGVPLALSGQSGSCFYQGTDGSNPSGFNVNLDPGMAVTQTIVANDQTDNLPFTNTEAASVADATEEALKAGVIAFDASLSLLFGGPFTLIIAMATNLIDVSEYCNNQPNLMQLGAVVASTGQGSNSTMWSVWDGAGGTSGGFANVYSSPWKSSAPTIDAQIATNAVQLAPDATNTYDGQPLWLAQTPIEGCGIGDAKDSNTSGCTSQNLISLRWSQEMPCPFNNGIEPAQGAVYGDGSYCYLPAPTSPEVPSCGTNNAQCQSYVPDA